MLLSIARRRVQDWGVEVFGWLARDRPRLSRPSMHRTFSREKVTWIENHNEFRPPQQRDLITTAQHFY